MALGAHYARLGLAAGRVYTRTEVAAAYRAAALRTHPDLGGCAQAFAQLTASYEAAIAATKPPRVYAPSSLRSHGSASHSGGTRGKENARFIAALIIPVFTLTAVSVRLLQGSKDGAELRAGGTSRVSPIDARFHASVRACANEHTGARVSGEASVDGKDS